MQNNGAIQGYIIQFLRQFSFRAQSLLYIQFQIIVQRKMVCKCSTYVLVRHLNMQISTE